jgi:hypothetical protein
MPGPIEFQFACPNEPGLTCKVDKEMIKAGEQAKFLVEFKYRGIRIRPELFASLWVLPFNLEQQLPIVEVQKATPAAK